jgi:hypothetical protein
MSRTVLCAKYTTLYTLLYVMLQYATIQVVVYNNVCYDDVFSTIQQPPCRLLKMSLLCAMPSMAMALSSVIVYWQWRHCDMEQHGFHVQSRMR